MEMDVFIIVKKYSERKKEARLWEAHGNAQRPAWGGDSFSSKNFFVVVMESTVCGQFEGEKRERNVHLSLILSLLLLALVKGQALGPGAWPSRLALSPAWALGSF